MIHYPGIVIHPHVFCIVPSLPRWSLLPQHKFQIFTFHLCHSTYASSGSTLQFFCLKPDLIFFKDIISSLCIWRIASWLEAQGWKTPDNFLFSKVWEALKCTSILTEHKHPVVYFHSTSGGLWGLLGEGNWKQLSVTSEVARLCVIQLIGAWDPALTWQVHQWVGPPSPPLSLGHLRVHQWFIHAINHITKHW